MPAAAAAVADILPACSPQAGAVMTSSRHSLSTMSTRAGTSTGGGTGSMVICGRMVTPAVQPAGGSRMAPVAYNSRRTAMQLDCRSLPVRSTKSKCWQTWRAMALRPAKLSGDMVARTWRPWSESKT